MLVLRFGKRRRVSSTHDLRRWQGAQVHVRATRMDQFSYGECQDQQGTPYGLIFWHPTNAVRGSGRGRQSAISPLPQEGSGSGPCLQNRGLQVHS